MQFAFVNAQGNVVAGPIVSDAEPLVTLDPVSTASVTLVGMVPLRA